MDARDIHIINLMQKAIDHSRSISVSAKSAGPSWLFDEASHAITLLERGQELVRNKKLPRPSGGAGLLMVRSFGEWAGEYPEIMRLVSEIDAYYSIECNCPREDS